MPTDPSILQRVAIGDRTAVGDCIEQYGKLIWTIGRRYLRDTTDLEDVTQEVFIELWQTANRFDPTQGTEATFVALIARRRVIDRLRKRLAERARLKTQSIEQVEEIGVSRADSLIWGEEFERIVSCLEKLDAVRRKVLILHVRDGHSHVRISDALKVPLGTIKSHARRGLLQLQRCVGISAVVEQVSSLSSGDV